MDPVQIFFNSKNQEFQWMSNFFICAVTYLGINFDSAERCYQYAKAYLFGSTEYMQILLDKVQTPSALNCKQIVKNFFQLYPNYKTVWDRYKTDIMFYIVLNKFRTNNNLKDWLLGTSSKELVENTYDGFWGCGYLYTGNARKSFNLKRKTGLNHMGKILMKIRMILSGIEPLTTTLVVSDSMLSGIHFPSHFSFCVAWGESVSYNSTSSLLGQDCKTF